MAGFDDLIPAMPYLASELIEAAQGSTWLWEYEVRDDAGTLVPWIGITGACEVRTKAGAQILAVTLTLPSDGIVRCSATPAQTALIAPGKYDHEVELTRTGDGAKVKVVGAGDAHFDVKKQVF